MRVLSWLSASKSGQAEMKMLGLGTEENENRIGQDAICRKEEGKGRWPRR